MGQARAQSTPDAGSPPAAERAPKKPLSKIEQLKALMRHPGLKLKIYLVTIGPGDHPFFKFGHNAIWVQGDADKKNYVYNFGAMDFKTPGLIPKFFLGRFLYELDRRTIERELQRYEGEKRWLALQKLNLTPDQRWALLSFLKENYKEENRFYRYHYYRDNCSTRVRDALDKALGGRIRKAATGPASMSYRDHVQRLTADLLPEYVMTYLLPSAAADEPITEWEESFIPMKLQELVRKVTVVRPNGEQPLVQEEKLLLKDARTPPPERAPSWLLYFLLTGVVLGGGLAALGRAGRSRRALRIGAAIILGLFGFVFGLLGSLLVFIWVATDHDVMWANENILQLAPWLLALPLLSVGIARNNATSLQRAWWLTASAAGISAMGIVLKALPWFKQDNWLIVAVALPVWSCAALAIHWLRESRDTISEQADVDAETADPEGAKPEGAKTKAAEPDEAEPDEAEPDEAEPDEAEPDEADSSG